MNYIVTIFSTGGEIPPLFRFLCSYTLLTLVARSYVLLLLLNPPAISYDPGKVFSL